MVLKRGQDQDVAHPGQHVPDQSGERAEVRWKSGERGKCERLTPKRLYHQSIPTGKARAICAD